MATQIFEFKYFHLYNKLARRGLADPLVHKVCQMPAVLQEDKQTGRPYLKCFGCNVNIYPGANTYSRIVEKVREYFGDV